MTRDLLRALTDTELEQVGIWALEETRERQERRKQETIARIKQLAADNGVSVTINGARGRPRKLKEAKQVRP